jgi:hypothetical protein
MTDLSRATPRVVLLSLMLVAGVATGGRSQEVPLDREQLTRYARAHLALDAARDAYYAKIARIHDDVGLAHAREELEARVAQIYTENAITSERYGVITLLVSQNEQVRAVFEEISRQLRTGAGSP